MGNIFSIVVIFFFVMIFLSKNNKKSKNEKSNNAQAMQKYEAALAKGNAAKRAAPPQAVAIPVSKPLPSATAKASVPAYNNSNHRHKTANEAIGNKLMDDRNNDWLANQLREEHRAFKKTSEMFELKIEHVAHCDARYIEQFHHRYCDANKIDTARGH